MFETWPHRSHATVKAPRSANGLSEVARMLSDSGRAPEYNARFPTGRAVGVAAASSVSWPVALVADGTQNNARFPKGSEVRPPSVSATAHITFMAAETCRARSR